MNRDFKPRQSAGNARNGARGSGLLLGVFIGFLLGLATAAAIAIYVFKTPVPFANKTAPAAKPGESAPDAGTLGKAGKAEVGKPRFDFYRILPGQEEPVTDKQLREAASKPASMEKGDKAAADSRRDIYFIQAGAFQNPADADNLKAKLALLGQEASVEPTNVPEKGVWYRVRLGPFSHVEEINRVRSQLVQNGIEGSLVKIKDSAQ